MSKKPHLITAEVLAGDYDNILASSTTLRGTRKRLTSRVTIFKYNGDSYQEFVVTDDTETIIQTITLPKAVETYNDLN